MEAPACPVCQSNSERLFDAYDENRQVSDTAFPYARCCVCRCVFIVHIPERLKDFYPTDYYQIPALARLRRIAARDRYRIDLVTRFCNPNGSRLLEIGPAYGTFALQAKDAGFDVDAIEADARCCEYLRNVIGIRAMPSFQPHLAMTEIPKVDVIAIWHALEHLPDPVAVIEAACAKLNDGGVLAIAVPNPEAFQFRIMGRHWPHLDAPRHVRLLPAPTLSERVCKLGLSEIYRSSSDREARAWNFFGWRHLLINRFGNAMLRKTMSMLGFAPALIFAPLELGGLRGSAYTLVFRKPSP
jgi:SAM-dependent methyltransferase